MKSAGLVKALYAAKIISKPNFINFYLIYYTPVSYTHLDVYKRQLLTLWRDASSFLEAHGPINTTFAWGCFCFIVLAVATIGVSAFDILSIISGK